MKITNKTLTFLIGAGMLMMLASTPIFVLGFLAENSLFLKIPFGLLAVSAFIVPIIFFKSNRLKRLWLSYFYIDERGIANKIYFSKSKDIFIAWNEIADIAIKPVANGKGVYSEYVYFCKIPLDDYFSNMHLYKHYKKVPAYKNSYGIGQDENLLCIAYSEKLLGEVLKHVSRDRIRNLHTLTTP